MNPEGMSMEEIQRGIIAMTAQVDQEVQPYLEMLDGAIEAATEVVKRMPGQAHPIVAMMLKRGLSAITEDSTEFGWTAVNILTGAILRLIEKEGS